MVLYTKSKSPALLQPEFSPSPPTTYSYSSRTTQPFKTILGKEKGLWKSDLSGKVSKEHSQRVLQVIVKLVTPRVKVVVGVKVRVSFIFNILFQINFTFPFVDGCGSILHQINLPVPKFRTKLTVPLISLPPTPANIYFQNYFVSGFVRLNSHAYIRYISDIYVIIDTAHF